MRRLSAAATTRSAYDATQRTDASRLVRLPGKTGDRERDDLQADRREEEPRRPEPDLGEPPDAATEDETEPEREQDREREDHD